MKRSAETMSVRIFSAEAYCRSSPVVIDVNPVDGEVTPGCKLVIDGKEFKIVKVGEVANENLKNLGHVTYNFGGEDAECLPGTICMEKAELPALDIGSTIAIVK